jgi:hypothetical protein
MIEELQQIKDKLGKRIEITVDGKFLLGAHYLGEINNSQDTLKMLKELVGFMEAPDVEDKEIF